MGESPSPVAPRWRLRLFLSLAAAALVPAVVGLAARLAFNYRQAQSRLLQAAMDELDARDPGWRLDEVERARAEVPEADNAASVVVAAYRLLPGDWPPQEVNDLNDVPPQELLGSEQLALLARELDRVAPAVAEARKLAGLPRGRYPITYEPTPVNPRTEDQQKARPVAALLGYDARRLAQAGDLGAALASCRAALNAGRSLGDEPLGGSQIMRTACVTLACLEIERVLARGVPGGEGLAATQRLLEEEDRFPTLLVAFRGERATHHELCWRVGRGESSLDEDPPEPPSLVSDLLGRGERGLVRYEHHLLLRALTRRVAVARLPVHEQPDALRDLAAEEDRDLPADAIMTRLFMMAQDRPAVAFWRKHAQVRCLAALLAVERSRQAAGRWPDRLGELVPRFLPAVPLDPFDGKPLRYRRLGDGVAVYSVGGDRADDGGVLDRQEPTRPGPDLGYRLWDAEARRPASRGR